MKKEYIRDIGWGVFFLLLALFVWIVAPYQIPVPRQTTAMGPRFFPKFISLLLGLVSIGLIFNTLLKHRREIKAEGDNQAVSQSKKEVHADDRKEALKGEIRAVIVLVLMVLYTITMPLVGFIISSIVIGSAILFVLSGRKWYYYLILIASILLIYYVFKFQLYVQLP